MKYLYIVLEPLPGTSIRDAITQAKDAAFRKSCDVGFKFNGIPMHVKSDSTVRDQLAYYDKASEANAYMTYLDRS